MATVQLISGYVLDDVKLTEVKQVGEEGSRTATAHIDGKTYHVYNSIVDGFNDIWYEQMSRETYQMTKGATGFVEGSATTPEENAEEAYTATTEDEAIYAGLLAVQVVTAIQHEYNAGKLADLETYNRLYAIASKADRQVQRLVKLLETKAD